MDKIRLASEVNAQALDPSAVGAVPRSVQSIMTLDDLRERERKRLGR